MYSPLHIKGNFLEKTTFKVWSSNLLYKIVLTLLSTQNMPLEYLKWRFLIKTSISNGWLRFNAAIRQCTCSCTSTDSRTYEVEFQSLQTLFIRNITGFIAGCLHTALVKYFFQTLLNIHKNEIYLILSQKGDTYLES